jgi:hypothetical protein
VAPWGIRSSAASARGSSQAGVLAERNTDDNLIPGHAGNFAAGLLNGRHVLQDLGTEDTIERVVLKLKLGRIAGDRFHSWTFECGFREIESRYAPEMLREKL